MLELFNSNPDFVADLEGSSGRRAYSLDEVREWSWFTGQMRKNQLCLALRTREDARLVGLADLLIPHPRGDYAALGLLLLHGDWQGKRLGREAALAIEAALVAEGWSEVELVVQRIRPRSRKFWESCGYSVIGEGPNESGHPCWVMRKRVGETAPRY